MFTKKQKWSHYNQELQSITTKRCACLLQFQANIWNIQLGSGVYTIIGIYHLSQGTEQQFSNSNFINQLTDLLTEELPKHQDLIIMGDIHIHINDRKDEDAQTLLDTIAAFNLKQHINI